MSVTLHVVGAVFTEPPATQLSELTSDTRVLAFRRGPGRDAAGLWEFAGGKLEPDESTDQALVREIDEELGIAVRVGECILTSEVWVEPRQRFVTLTCYLVTPIEAAPTVSTDHDELRWMPITELHSLDWITPDVPVFERLQQQVKR